MSHARTRGRRAAAAALLTLSLAACGTQDKPAGGGDKPEDVAVRWLTASNDHDPQAYCNADEAGATDMRGCVDKKAAEQPRSKFVKPPTVLAVHDWTRADGTKGKAVVVQRHVSANPDNMTPDVFGLAKVPQDPDHWRVVEFTSYEGDPDSADAVSAALAAEEG